MSEKRDPDPGVHDHQSDPARTPGDGWGGEGGASHLGPATATRAGHPDSDEHETAEAAEEAAGEEQN